MIKRTQYSGYKSSGVSWLGQVPDHWQIKPLWAMFRRVKRTGYENEELLSVYRDYGVIIKSSRDDNINKASEDLTPYQLVNVGDLAINKMKAWQGSVGISSHRGIVSPAYFIFEAKHSENSRYLHYLMRSTGYIAGYLSISKGIRVGQWDLDSDHHARMPVLIPTLCEQIEISSFLDRETSRIDTLISKKTKFIELLKEKRQAVITKVVTNGLNDCVPQKDSGIEWVVKIPAHWVVKPLFSVSHEIKSKNKGMLETNLLSLSYGQVVQRDINASEGLLPASFETYQIVEPNDIVFRLTDLQNDQKSLRTAIVKERGIITSAYVVARATEEIYPDYLNHLLRAYDSRKVFYSMGGGMRQSMKYSDLRRMPLLIPPLVEQENICRLLRKQTSRVEALMKKTERSIDLLKEHRSALITAAVTGKIDVRENT